MKAKVFHVDARESVTIKPKKGSKYKIAMDQDYLSLEADYQAVVDIGEAGSPDYANRKMYFSTSFARGSIGTIAISMVEFNTDTQKNTYSLEINDMDCFYFEEDQMAQFQEIYNAIKSWNVVS